MQTKLHRFFLIATGIVLVTVMLIGCSMAADDPGTIRLSLTDAPIADAKGVEGVFITISSIEYNLNGAWIEDTGFEGPQEFNLLDLTGGTVAPLTNTVISAGEVTQIRFKLDAQEDGASPRSTPGSYIVIDSRGEADGTIDENDDTYELFVPSGSQTGYKAVGSFTIPSNGEVEITADLDVRKSVVKRGSKDEYILKPTTRLIVNNQAGTIDGSFDATGSPYAAFSVFAYEEGVYTDSESLTGTEDPETFVPFENAVSSAAVDITNGSYILPFLTAGIYDLIVVGVGDDGSYTVVDTTTYVDIVVEAETTTTRDISLTIL